MKTVKTANGIKKIEDWNYDLVPLQLRSILQEHRSTLITRLIQGGVESYIDYKFNKKIQHQQLTKIINDLESLKRSGIDIDTYEPIFQDVLDREYTALTNALFYAEIDRTIQETLQQSNLFTDRNHFYFR
jgi:hypothetical protein